MSFDDLLRRSLRKDADGARANDHAWAEVRARADARRRRRHACVYAMAGLGTVVLVVALAVGVAAVRDGDGESRSVTAASSGSRPQKIEEAVALTADGRVVAIDAKTGVSLRTLAQGAMTELSGLTVDREGGVVYFTRPWANAPCVGLGPSGAVPELVRVALTGGPVEGLAPMEQYPVTGYYPVVTPDGQFVAFMGGPCGEGLLAGFYLPTPRTPAGPIWAATAANTIVKPLAWSSDSERVLFEAVPNNESAPRLLVADEPVNGRVPVRTVWGPGGYTAATYRQDVLVIAEDRDGSFRVVEAGRAHERELFRAKGPSPTAMEFDESGDELLYVAEGKLFRWHTGDKRPKQLAEGIIDAEWAPSA
ncbi:MAG: hypothetical protein ACT452_03810 [Microthrixaceae bacterium]